MAKKCTTTPGPGVCCRAAEQGLLGKPFVFTIASGCLQGQQRCGECTTVPSRSKKHPNIPVFQFRFHKNTECGLSGAHGCPALQQGARAGVPVQTTQAPTVSP